MNKYIKIIAVLLTLGLTLGGCGLTDSQIGTTTTTIYDSEGKVIQKVEEDLAVGDKYTSYSNAVVGVGVAIKEGIKSKVEAIMKATEGKVGEDPVASAYKQAMGVMAISSIEDTTPEAIRSIHYGDDGYSVMGKGVDTIPSVITGALGWKGIDATEKVLTTGFKEAGDDTALTMGDGNTAEGFNKSEVDSEIHATAIGEGSYPSVNDGEVSSTQTPEVVFPPEVTPEEVPEVIE